MAKIDIIVGTTLGGTEYVADELAAKMTELGHQNHIHLAPQLADLDPKSIWLVVSSTHGAGDLPDNLQPLLVEINQQKPDLQDLKYILCAVGDSSYDTFCQGPEHLIQAFAQCGATPLVNKIQIDIQYQHVPEDAAVQWFTTWQDQL